MSGPSAGPLADLPPDLLGLVAAVWFRNTGRIATGRFRRVCRAWREIDDAATAAEHPLKFALRFVRAPAAVFAGAAALARTAWLETVLSTAACDRVIKAAYSAGGAAFITCAAAFPKFARPASVRAVRRAVRDDHVEILQLDTARAVVAAHAPALYRLAFACASVRVLAALAKEAGVDADTVPHVAVHHAIITKRTEALRVLFAEFGDEIVVRERAARLEMVRANSEDLRTTTPGGISDLQRTQSSLLHAAAVYGNAVAFELFADHNMAAADLAIDDFAAIRSAVKNKHVGVLSTITQKFAPRILHDVASFLVLSAACCDSAQVSFDLLFVLATEYGLGAEAARENFSRALYEAACRGHAASVDLLFDRYKLTLEDLRATDNAILRATAGNGHAGLLENFAKRGLTAEDARANDNECLYNATLRADTDMLRVLARSFKLDKTDVCAQNYRIFRTAVLRGSTGVLKVFAAEYGVGGNIARIENFVVMRAASAPDDSGVEILRMCAVDYKFTKADVCCENNMVLRIAARHGNFKVLELLAELYGLNRMDARAENNDALLSAATYGHSQVLVVLADRFGLGPADAAGQDGLCVRLAHAHYIATTRGLVDRLNTMRAVVIGLAASDRFAETDQLACRPQHTQHNSNDALGTLRVLTDAYEPARRLRYTQYESDDSLGTLRVLADMYGREDAKALVQKYSLSA